MGYTLVLDTTDAPTIQSEQIAITGWAVATEASLWAESLIRAGAPVRVVTVVPEFHPHALMVALGLHRRRR
ncbi:hypothetical protein [Sciscionella marina]|uniref:hypothetical protein n=1 Tax=Sciscionella marina TaxID=508770 RepID=UPI00036A68BF|nr:hypothetical protein [Sciscionella marina]